MRPINDFNKVKASTQYERLAPGGYVIRITDVKDEDAPDKQYLRIVYDIAEGSEAGRYKNEDKDNEYRHAFVRSYKETALGMLKAFTEAVDQSNGTKLTESVEKGLDEKLLIGKLVGIVFGYEEYEANDGNVKERIRVASVLPADKIREGEYKVPELKKLAAKASAGIPEGFTALKDDDLPF